MTHLRLNLAGLKTFHQLRDEILQYHKTVRVINQDGTSRGPAPMEVDALVDVLQNTGLEGLVAALHNKGYFKGKGKGSQSHLGGSYSNNNGYFGNSFNKGKGYKGKGHFKGGYNNKGKSNFKGKGKGKNYKGNNFKGKGGKGKNKGKGPTSSSLGSTLGQPPQGTVNALEQDSSATTGS